MSGERYALGLDFGTGSARAVLLNISDGAEAGQCSEDYPHGVLTESLPGATDRLPAGWALQDADDYLAVAGRIIPALLRETGIAAEQIAGVGVDFTACTLIPCSSEGEPLSRDPALRARPHAWTKLWKHHGASLQAERINTAAAERAEPFLPYYGGLISPEWLLPKAWQVLEEDPDIYDQTATFVDAGDWLVWQLTGNLTRSACQAGYKGFWSRKHGWPDPEFLKALDPRLESLFQRKVTGPVLPVGSRAGAVTAAAARLTGLREGTPVACSIIDAHAALPGAGIAEPGAMLLILGTSGCQLLLSETGKTFPGIAGVVEDGILPGYFGYEAGQAATGDILAWFCGKIAPSAAAANSGGSIFAVLEEEAAALKPGESGLLALDWWNGNRSILMDSQLSGLIAGLTLETTPAEIYRCLLEATAFGARAIVENFRSGGVQISRIVAAGGMSHRNNLALQLYADILGEEIAMARSSQSSAAGAAILGAVAAGGKCEGPAGIAQAARAMGGLSDQVFRPRAEARPVYDELFRLWMQIHDSFGRQQPEWMHRLRSLSH